MVPLASTGVPPFFSVFLALTSPRSPSRVRAPPCSPPLASRATTVCIESPGDQSISCHKPFRIGNNSRPTRHNHQKTRGHHSSSPELSSRVKPCGKSCTASRLRGLTPTAIPVFWLPCLRRRSPATQSRSPTARFKISHAAGHRRCSDWSLSNSCLRASLPAVLAAAMV
jgi:hypothetical protein